MLAIGQRTAGSTISVIGLLSGIEVLMILAGYLSIICAIVAWYTARLELSSFEENETYVRVGGKWTYLYRAVDSQGNTIENCNQWLGFGPSQRRTKLF
jgi:DDE superfamily endonuclease